MIIEEEEGQQRGRAEREGQRGKGIPFHNCSTKTKQHVGHHVVDKTHLPAIITVRNKSD